ncbi:hypothetical protein FACS1894159_02090 [Bacteroidia bacterium]|nr:hypothetical protein FACS1894159_02090 [Bacteroidia bacterium]
MKKQIIAAVAFVVATISADGAWAGGGSIKVSASKNYVTNPIDQVRNRLKILPFSAASMSSIIRARTAPRW